METDEEKEIAKPWMTTSINFSKVKDSTDKIIAIFSTDDPFVPLSDMRIFGKELGAEIVIKEGVGHFDDDKYDVILTKSLELIK